MDQSGEDMAQRNLLWTILIINFSFFLIEIISGLISVSMGLVADSLDMLADSIVYGLSLIAVGGTALLKKRIAKIAGYLQLTLAGMGFLDLLGQVRFRARHSTKPPLKPKRTKNAAPDYIGGRAWREVVRRA